MPEKYLVQRRTATGLETVAELPMLAGDKIDIAWLPVVGSIDAAIIERGSNANGIWIKLADGTMICESTIIKNGINVLPDQSIWLSSEYVPPVAFHGEFGICIVYVTTHNNDTVNPASQYIGLTYYGGQWNIYNTGNSGAYVHPGNAVRSGGTINVISATIKVVAFGRWK